MGWSYGRIDGLIRHENNLRSPVYGVMCYFCAVYVVGVYCHVLWEVRSMRDKDGRTSRCFGAGGVGGGRGAGWNMVP